jgi:hypothetical protein
MSPLDLVELERLEKEATPGLWTASDYEVTAGAGRTYWAAECDNQENAEFIAVSRNALPELIAALKIAVGGLRKIRNACRCTDLCDCSTEMKARAIDWLTEVRKLVSIE